MEFKSTILIVDDSEAGRVVLDQLLSDSGYNLEFAEDGFQALDMVKKNIPDLILLDVMMPGMDGYEVCKKIREDSKTAELPIIMVSMLDDLQSRLQGIEAGADDFITKPFNLVELELRVKTITRLNRYRRIHAERKKLDWVIDNTLNGILVIDDNNKILFANRKARLYLNIAEEFDVKDQIDFLKLINVQYKCEPKDKWKNAFTNSMNQDKENSLFLVRPESKNSDAFWLEVTMLSAPGGINTERMVQLKDITDEIKEAKLERTFQGVILHKLRTPLNSLAGTFELFKLYKEDMEKSEIMELIDIAGHSFKRLHDEVEGILNYVTTPSGTDESVVHFAMNKCEDLVKEIREDLQVNSVVIKGLESVIDYKLPIEENSFKWIMMELINNSMKFHPTQNPDIELELYKQFSSISIKVTDNGQNISPDQLDKVWRPYFQGEKYFTGETPGMGVGLSTVATIIWGVDGECNMYNRSDSEGVIVELLIPCR